MPGTNTKTPNSLCQFEHILEELNEGVGIADDQLRLIFANDALWQLAQYNREEIRGNTPNALFPAEDLPFVIPMAYGAEKFLN